MPIINGTSGGDTLNTGPGPSVVHGLGGDDYISDSWFLSEYADELYGDDGNDQIYAWGGDDLLFGGAGDDILAGGFGADTLDGGDDNDTLIDNQAGGDTLLGGAGDDLITVSHPTSATPLGPLGTLTTIEGGIGNDRIELIYGRTLQTSIDAGDGDDYVQLTRSAGLVTLTLGAGSDTVELARNFGGWPLTGLHITDFGTDDRLKGLSEFLFYAIGPWDGDANPFATGQLRVRQAGADTLLERNFVGTGDTWDTILSFDNVNAASLTAAQLDGFDPTGTAPAPRSLDGSAAGEELYGGQGDDVIHGNDGADILTGNAGDDALYGGEGDDTLVGGVGTDLLDGGAGNDDFDVSANGADTVIGGDGDDTLFYRRDDRNFFGYPIAGGTSHVDMGAGNDHLTIHNFAGELVVDAGAGDDTIFTLGFGYRLTLGAGADAVEVSSAATTLTVTDFNPAEDRFSHITGMLSTSGSVPADPFAANLIRLVQQGADTAVQISPFFPEPYTNTAILLLGVDARSLNAANFGGYAPDGIWAFGTSGDDVLTGGTGKDRLTDDKNGSDSLDGGAGNDILTWSRGTGATGTSTLVGGAGDDRFNLSGGNADSIVHADGGADNDDVHLAGIAGRTIVTLGAGQDVVTFDAFPAGIPAGSAAAVTDFATGAGGDALALAPFLGGWLIGWNAADNPFATGHARLAQSGAATLLQLDRDGGGDSWMTVLTLEGTDAASLRAANLGGWDSGTFGNQAPVLAAGAGIPSSYVEGDGALRFVPSATLADADSPDFAGGTLTVTLAGAVADDLVAVRSDGAGGIAVSGGIVSYLGTAIGTLSGGAGIQNLVVSFNADATAAAVEALVRNLTYAGTTDAMVSGQRVLTIAVTDGDGGAAQIVSELSAYAVNDAPTIAGLGGDIAHYVEGSGAVRLDVGADALIGDADSPDLAGGTLRVAITANGNPLQDMLGVEGGGRLGVFGNQIAFDGLVFASSDGGGPGSDLVFTFNSVATPEAVTLLLRGLTYINLDGVAPAAATRAVTLTLTDGDGTDLGGADTRVVTTQVEIAAINDAPQLSEPFEPIVHYNEGGPFASLFGGVYLGDAEYRAGYGGGSLTLSVSGGTGAIELADWAGFHAVSVGGDFDLIYDNGTDPTALVGRIAGLGTASVIVDSFAAPPPNVFSYLISAFIYVELGDAPSATPRTASVIFNDGGNGNGVGALSASRTQAIQMVAQNDAPVLSFGSDGTIAYTHNAAAASLFAGVTIADPDRPASFSGGVLQLTTGGIGAGLTLIGARFLAQDGGGGQSIIDTVTGLEIGVMSRGPGTLSVALTGGATPEAVTALAGSFGFLALGDDASLGARGVFMTLDDGGNDGAGGSFASNTVFVIVDVQSDPLTGTAGDDVLSGTPGADILRGFGGNDTYHVDNAGDVVTEAAGGGTDVVYSSVSYELVAGSAVEILSTVSLAGTAALTLVGNSMVQLIYGNAGSNLLAGGGGADRLVGLGGDDTYIITDGSEAVFESVGGGNDIVYTSVSHALASGQEIELLSTISNAATNALDLTGNEYANTIYGNDGINNLRGGGGTGDKLIGLGGNDVYFIVDGSEAVFEATGGGSDVVYTLVSHALAAGQEIEILSAISNSASNAMDLTGNELTNVIYGNNGVNNLRGGGGNGDVLIGFGGNDVYYIVSGGERVFEAAGGGTDVVYTNVSHMLAAGQEIEILSAISNGATTAMDLTGNDIANTIYANNGANIINGGGGSDVLFGYGGADTFAFTTASGAGNVDTLADFLSGTDKIQLEDAVFTGLAPGALNANAFVIGTAAQDADDRIIYNSATGALFFDADGNGTGAAVQFATLSGQPALAASDFTVI